MLGLQSLGVKCKMFGFARQVKLSFNEVAETRTVTCLQ